MKIGSLEIRGKAAFAPMAGVADRAVRELMIEHGAAFTVSELISAKGVSLGDKKSKSLLFCSDAERPAGVQLFGCDPEVMAEAAKAALECRPDFIDINMGCPAPKVAGNGGGSALMKDPALAGRIVESVAKAVDIPVTVKIRTGWDSEHITAIEVAKAAEAGGAKAIAVHGRTRQQMYSGNVDFETIANVKSAVDIPVIANGDIIDGMSAKEMLDKTGCDMVMIGRGALGNPFLFEAVNAYLERGEILTPPSLEDRLAVMREEVRRMLLYKDERRAFLEARTHVGWYMKGLKGAAALRRMCGEISSMEDIDRICEEALAANKNGL